MINKKAFSSEIKKIQLAENVLLLQGPIGPFFKKFAGFCKKNGSKSIYKINFSLGDSVFNLFKNSTLYKKGLEEWEDYLRGFIAKNNIQQIYMLSDARPLHVVAIRIAKELNIPAYVFEQGYIRPNRITLELYGVNGQTNLCKDKDFYLNSKLSNKADLSSNNQPTMFRFYLYYLPMYISTLFLTRFLNKDYHELLHLKANSRSNALKQTWNWLSLCVNNLSGKLNFFSKKIYKENMEWVSNESYYTLVLQVPDDYQILRDSKYNNMYELIDEVISSFKENSNADTKLLIKHHPFDLHNNYKTHIDEVRKKHNLDRSQIKYINEAHLPTVFQKTIGTITINSTAGLSALWHKSPVICLSTKAIFNIKGITYQNSLHRFWNDAKSFEVDRNLVIKFKNHVDWHTQIVGSGFWGDCSKNRFHELFEVKSNNARCQND